MMSETLSATGHRRWPALAFLLAVLAAALATIPSGAAELADLAAAQTPPKPAGLSLLDLLRLGGPFMWPIYLASLVGLTLLIERALALRRSKVIPAPFVAELTARLRTRHPRPEILAFCHANDNPFSRVAAAGLRKLDKDVETVEQAIEDAGANEVGKLRRNLRLLYGVASISPMLGLLGTVWGMIYCFKVTSDQGLGAENLASGIYQALITTLAGLCVAIPVLVSYYFFQAKIEQFVWLMNDNSLELLTHMDNGHDSQAKPAGEVALASA